MSDILTVFFTAMIPIGELRAALPIGIISFKMNIVDAYIISVLGNIFPIFFLLWFWHNVAHILRRFSFFDRFFDWLFERTRHKFADKYDKWGKLALVLFVAIPLPVTGAWTGSVAAWLFGYKYWESVRLIFFGLLISGLIVAILTLTGQFLIQ